MLVSIYDTCRGQVRYAYEVGRSATARRDEHVSVGSDLGNRRMLLVAVLDDIGSRGERTSYAPRS